MGAQPRIPLSDISAAVAPLDLRLKALEERAASEPVAASSSSPKPISPLPAGSTAADYALLAVQELEGLLRQEVRELRKHYNMLQEAFDEHVVMPLRQVELKLSEHDQKVAQCLDVGQDCASRVQEQEFRLGVTRTKLEVHDQKLAILDRNLRQGRRLDAEAQHVAPDRPDSPTWPTAVSALQGG